MQSSQSADPIAPVLPRSEALPRQEALPERARIDGAEYEGTPEELNFIRHNWAFRILRNSNFVWLDLLLLLVTLLQVGVAATVFRHGTSLRELLNSSVPARDLLLLASCLVLWSPIFWICGLYRQFNLRHLAPRIPVVLLLCTAVLLGACRVWTPRRPIGPAALLFFIAGNLVIFLPRIAVVFWSRVKKLHTRQRNVVLLGSGNLAQRLAWKLRHESQQPRRILGFLDTDPQPGHYRDIGGFLGPLSELESLLMTNVVDEVHIALPFKSHYGDIQQAVRLCESAGVEPHYMAELFPTQVTKKVHSQEGRVVLRLTHADSRFVLKRILDVVVAVLGLLVISPLMLAIAVLVKLSGPGPIIFRQTRYGLNKRSFTMFKFRSMVSDAEQQQKTIEHMNEQAGPIFKITRDPRITPIGVFLRKTSLDELPQLFNVIAGNMSLVGPRPLNLRDVHRFSELHLMRRFSVLPGMTGLWQVSGRSNLDFSDWIELDLKYIDEWSLKLDLRILAMTLPAVLKGRGAS